MSRLKGAWNTASKSLGSYKIPYTRSLQSEPRNSIELQNGAPATDDNFSSTRREPVSDNDSALEEQIPPPDRKPASRSYTKGWRFGAISCAVSVTIVFFINLGLTIYGSITYTSVLFEGDCGKVETLNTVLHLLINALSTILLSSSNYCMQCLSAPTRSEVDKAHARGIWLDIGIPSVRNLRRINRNRVVLWALLAITSLPLHLFYNSAVFSSLSSYNYHAVSVNQSFVDSEDCVGCNNPAYLRLDELHQKARSGILERLEPADCINQYAQAIQDNRRSVLLVASDDALPPADNNTYGMIQSNPHAYWLSALDARDVFLNNVDAYSWMCPNKSSDLPCSSDINQFKSSPDTWRVGNCYYNHEDCTNKTYPVQYCLSERAEPHCKLQFSLIIAIVCTILNLLKALIMFYVAFRIVENPLITMGDAVASFLEHEDRTTRCIGLTSMKNIRYWSDYQLGPEEWRGGLSRWKDVISRHRWDITIAMFFLAASLLATGTGLSIAGLGTNQKSLPALARLGFGAIRQRLIIFQLLDSATVVQMGSPNNIIPAALAANSPQPALSFIYFTYNGVFTAMLLGWEWCSYSDKRKGLRLSQPPAGEQRSTYFLSLPYRFAFPLMVASGLLHWFTSRALFVIAIDFYGFDGQNASNLKTCGYSPIAMIATLILFVVMILAMVAFGYVPYKRADGMPLAGSCSIAISAACHPEQYIKIEGNPAEQKVKYGVVAESVDGIGHCAFSPKEVKPLEKGKVYAGSGPWCRRRNSPSIVSVYVDDDL